jgi:hypothetical protein
MTDPRVGHFRNPRKSTLLCWFSLNPLKQPISGHFFENDVISSVKSITISHILAENSQNMNLLDFNTKVLKSRVFQIFRISSKSWK